MIYRDVTAIKADNNNCNTVNSNTVIYGYKNNNRTRYTYTLIEDKYIKTQEYNSTYGYDVGNSLCLSDSQIEQLPAFANYYTPFYGCMAFGMCVCVFGLVWFCVKSIFGRRV